MSWNVTSQTPGGKVHKPALGHEEPRPDCAPVGQNPWSAYRFTSLPVTCKKCLDRA